MPRDRLTFPEREVRAAIKAAKQAGLAVAKVKISPQGEIEIIVDDQDDMAKAKARPNPWDEFYENPPEIRSRVARPR
jgi:hypothetical protein